MGLLWFVRGLLAGAGGMFAFHARVKKALEEAKFELEEQLDKLKNKLD